MLMRYFEVVKTMKGAKGAKKGQILPSSPETFSFS